MLLSLVNFIFSTVLRVGKYFLDTKSFLFSSVGDYGTVTKPPLLFTICKNSPNAIMIKTKKFMLSGDA